MDRICILGVFAHPDDEFSISGLILRAISMGAEVHLVLVTSGESGKIRNKKRSLLERMSVADIRLEEYRESCTILRITKYHHLGLKDGESKKWDLLTATAKLSDIIQEVKPTHVISFDKNGCNGHPDHIATSAIVVNALNSFKEVSFLSVKLHSQSLLNYIFWWMPRSIKKHLINRFGIEDKDITFIYRLSRKELSNKLRLLKIYNSQFPDEKNRYYKVKKPILKMVSKYECYYSNEKKNNGFIERK